MGCSLLILLLLSSVLFFGSVCGKECTNTPTQLSKTDRYELLSSNNETWKAEVNSHYLHLTPTDDSAWADLFPRKILKEDKELDWALMYKRIKNPDISDGKGDKSFLKEMSLHDVRLDPDTIQGRGQQTNLEYLLLLDVDSLVWSFRKTAGLKPAGNPYGGWEKPDCELRGHFVGHYLSATAKTWASTHNQTLYEKMNAVLSVLKECQDTMGTGYLSAFPTEEFDRFEAIKAVWAPYYTIHKILAGLLDQYSYAGNSEALKMAILMAEYFGNRVQNVIQKYTIERHWMSLNEETGGMNDVLYKMYSITGNERHLVLAHLFDKPCFLGALALKDDDLSGFHSNTHIPIVIGSQMRYEVTGDPLYKEIGMYFMDVVNSSHSYASGGTSVHEFWSDPKHLATTLRSENEESCTTYNMLKVSRHLFRWTKEIAYADYYERALTNGVLGIQRGQEPGIMIYMLPLAPGSSKARTFHGWGSQFGDFWCCYGTGIESFSKLGDSIYFEEEGSSPGLYVIQYVSSTVNWTSGNIVVTQKVDPVVSWKRNLTVTLSVSANKEAAGSSTLNLRIPSWTHSKGAKAMLNAESLSLPPPGNFLSVSRQWKNDDKLTIVLPMSLRTEAIKDDRSEYATIQAILYGPYLLAGLSNGDWEIKTGSANSPSEWLTEVPEDYNSHLVSLSQETDDGTFAIINSDYSIKMDKLPSLGTESSVNATFRLIYKDGNSTQSSLRDNIIGKSVMLEPFSLPGTLVAEEEGSEGSEGNLVVQTGGEDKGSSMFRVVAGLDGKANTISLESDSTKGLYICTIFNHNGNLEVKMKTHSDSDDFHHAASFAWSKGISKYHPISFVAHGANRKFLLVPLLSIRDERYTVYFNITK
ncbi:hypothetical protein Sjap_013068 [Stephania japonica]|uniref:Uncharacterized protein n=1 Tax=Stephania japonica TaxID=461633 RepID=A0AAP0IZP3_9MAGN